MKIEERFIRQAIALAGQARARGNHPFGALLALDGQVLLTAENTVNTEANPTGHAETNLVLQAVRALAPEQIKNATLYTSCEPCAMCTGAMYWAGIRKVVFALSCQELAKLAGNDFLIPCRELLVRARDPVEVAGPFLSEEALEVQLDFWNSR
ncbi:MAG: nucleoside deaminase [bacterium]